MQIRDIDLNGIENAGIRADLIRQHYSFVAFWYAMGEDKPLGEINNLWTQFLYANTGAATLSEHFEVFNRNRS